MNDSSVLELRLQHDLASQWHAIDPTANIEVAKTLNDANDHVASWAVEKQPVQVLATGDFHMVGSILGILNSSSDLPSDRYVRLPSPLMPPFARCFTGKRTRLTSAFRPGSITVLPIACGSIIESI